ncbi:MAG: hypothetical protein ACTHJ4_01470, partial [Candidatus Nucleicultricaceae bacterium]
MFLNDGPVVFGRTSAYPNTTSQVWIYDIPKLLTDASISLSGVRDLVILDIAKNNRMIVGRLKLEDKQESPFMAVL